MAAPIYDRMRAEAEARYRAPKCPACGLKDRATGAAIGCQICVVHVVLES